MRDALRPHNGAFELTIDGAALLTNVGVDVDGARARNESSPGHASTGASGDRTSPEPSVPRLPRQRSTNGWVCAARTTVRSASRLRARTRFATSSVSCSRYPED